MAYIDRIPTLFTCNSCGVGFATPDLQRRHMKTDWHRYNLKRRVATLPPISAEIFAERVMQQMDVSRKQEERLAYVQVCEKKLSHKHKTSSSVAASVVGDDGESIIDGSLNDGSEDAEVGAEDENEDINDIISRKLKNAVTLPVTACIFCYAANFADVDATVAHMQKEHSFFIPERSYLVDLEGLVKYLSEKVSIGNACLYCSFIGRSLNSVRDHMIMKQHHKIAYDTEDERYELSHFYDFRSSYPEGEDENEEDEEWEDEDGEAEDGDGDNVESLSAVVAPRQVTESNLVLDSTGFELSLPLSGLRIGHRSLARYYRQSLRPTPELRGGQETVITASSRKMLTAAARDPIRARNDKTDWRKQAQKQSRDVQREQRYVNQLKHYRDHMLQ
ncbi:C2H2 type zinc-finger-domain-containing protein [Lipomyces arxii]|uniref:C2H2 type zinc-finger-domain-containing protein n=1 Tax=Lipomyces arxii TaxID=56418 RepID=UPI0034CE01BD